MSETFVQIIECLATYSLWALAIGSGIRLFRETRGEVGIGTWAKVLGMVCLISTLVAFIWTVLICETHVA